MLIKQLISSSCVQADTGCGNPVVQNRSFFYSVGAGQGQLNRVWPIDDSLRVIAIPAGESKVIDITSLEDVGCTISMDVVKEIHIRNLEDPALSGVRSVHLGDTVNTTEIEKGGAVMFSAPANGFVETEYTIENRSEFQVSVAVTIAGVKE